jgi:hypothetical protein
VEPNVGPFGIGTSIKFRSREPIDINTVVAKWVDRKTRPYKKTVLLLDPCGKKGHHSVLKSALKRPTVHSADQDTFVVKFVCVGLHGSTFKPMHVLIQVNNKAATKKLESAPFILKGSRKTETRSPQLLRYYEDQADKNIPRSPSSAPTPSPSPTPLATTMTLIPDQVPQPTNQQNQDHRANPPQTTQIQELSALNETQGVPNPNESFLSSEGFSSMCDDSPLLDFGRGRIDN